MIREQLEHVPSIMLIDELLQRCEYGAVVVSLPTGPASVRIIRRWNLGSAPEACIGGTLLMLGQMMEHVRAEEVKAEPDPEPEGS